MRRVLGVTSAAFSHTRADLRYCNAVRADNRYNQNVDTQNMLFISENLEIPLSEILMTPIRAQGPGGQNVNKVSTAIHLRFDISHSPSLPEPVRTLLLNSHDQRINSEGIFVLKAQQFRSQEKNRDDALQRLQSMIQFALREKKPRKRTRPSKKSVAKRLDTKNRRGRLKQTRHKPADDS